MPPRVSGGLVRGQTLQVSVLLLHHDRLPERRPGRPLGLEHRVELLEGSAAGLDAQHEPHEAVDEVQHDKDQVVVPVDRLECNCCDVGVVQVGTVGKDDVLL